MNIPSKKPRMKKYVGERVLIDVTILRFCIANLPFWSLRYGWGPLMEGFYLVVCLCASLGEGRRRFLRCCKCKRTSVVLGSYHDVEDGIEPAFYFYHLGNGNCSCWLPIGVDGSRWKIGVEGLG